MKFTNRRPVFTVLGGACIASLMAGTAVAAPAIAPASDLGQTNTAQSGEVAVQMGVEGPAVEYVKGESAPSYPALRAIPKYEYATEELNASGVRVAEIGTTPIAQEDRDWQREQDPALAQLSVELMVLLEEHNENLAGVAFSSNDEYLEVYVVSVNGPGVSEVVSRADALGRGPCVVLIPVERSLSELWEAAASLDSLAEGTLSASPDYISNGLRAVPQTPLVEMSEPELVSLSQAEIVPKGARTAMLTQFGDIPLVVEPYEGPIDDQGRYNDTSPFYAGAAINNISTGAGCTLGVPLVINGTFTALTAGHCGSGGFRTPPGVTVGGQYTTAYPGNASRYGDWKLLYGQHYGLRLWNGAANSSSTSSLPIVGGVWGTLAVGKELCTSGRTTGQVCRFRVKNPTHPNVTSTSGVTAGYITSMTHQSTNGVVDTGGTRGGDSGGPVYYNNGSGGMITVGIVKGSSSDLRTYYFTRLQGVRQWNSGAYVG